MKGSTHGSSPTGIPTDTTALGAETITNHLEHPNMPYHEVIVGNVGSVYYGKSRTKALPATSPMSNPARNMPVLAVTAKT